jgi:hemerythrin superfamily protein
MTNDVEPVAPDGVAAAVQEVHKRIKSLLDDVAKGVAGRRDAFETLANVAAAHEAAEQRVVHPLTQRLERGEAVASARVDEEREGETALEELKELGVDDPKFDETFAKFRAAVLQHATNEETKEHPLLERELSAAESRQAAEDFRAAQSVSA